MHTSMRTIVENGKDPIIVSDQKIDVNPVHYMVMMADPLAIGYDKSTKLRLRKLDHKYDYDPNTGYLLSDVKISYDSGMHVLNIVADKHSVTTPIKLFGKLGAFRANYIDDVSIDDDDIYFRIGNIVFVKYKYYYLKDVHNIKRCYINTPVEIINCVLEKTEDNLLKG